MNQPAPYVIRLMQQDDVPTVVAIDRMSFTTPWHASSYLYELRHSAQSAYYVLLKPETDGPPPPRPAWLQQLRGLLGLAKESRVIGYVGFRLRPNDAHISTIAVHPYWRGKGLGELLLLTAVEKTLELENNVVSLEVRASNPVAQRLYRKYGFRFVGVHKNYYRDGEDAWLMEVDVSGAAYRSRLRDLRRALETRLHPRMPNTHP